MIDTRHTVEGAVVSYIIHQQNTHSTAVVCSGDSAEALLTGGVPLK